MKFSTLILGLFLSLMASAQNLTPEQQQQLLKDVQAMKEKIQKLEGQSTGGLKKVNYQNETTDKKSDGTAAAAEPTLSPAEMKKLTDDINALKARQAESQKILDQLDQDE